MLVSRHSSDEFASCPDKQGLNLGIAGVRDRSAGLSFHWTRLAHSIPILPVTSVAQVVQLVRPETPLTQTERGRKCSVEVKNGLLATSKSDVQAPEPCWASNPGAMPHLLACWIQHSSLGPMVQLAMLTLTDRVFLYLDWGALRLNSMFSAEVMRLETEVQKRVSTVSRMFPEIRAMLER